MHKREVSRRGGPHVFFCGVCFDNRARLLRDLKPILMRLNTTVLGAGWDTAALPFARNLRLDRESIPGYSRISQVASIFSAARRQFCYKNQEVAACMERRIWRTRWVNRNRGAFGLFLTVA